MGFGERLGEEEGEGEGEFGNGGRRGGLFECELKREFRLVEIWMLMYFVGRFVFIDDIVILW